jgi:hypothetical protein
METMAIAERDVVLSNPVCDMWCIITCVTDLGNFYVGATLDGKV